MVADRNIGNADECPVADYSRHSRYGKAFPDSRDSGNPNDSAQCAGPGNGSSRHTVMPLCAKCTWYFLARMGNINARA